MEKPLDTEAVATAMERAPDSVLLPFLARLRARRDTLAAALGGRSLRAEIVLLVDERRVVYRVVFTPAGHVELTGAYGFDPHLRFEGRPEDLLGIVFGTVETFDAVYGKVLVLNAQPNELLHYPAVRRILAEEARTCPSLPRQ